MATIKPTKLSEEGNTNIQLQHIDSNIKIVTWVLVAIVITLLIGVGAIGNDYLAMKQATYQALKDDVQEQNMKLEFLARGIEKLSAAVAIMASSTK